MRMWMVDPRVLCRKHLLGEHVEIHMLVGNIQEKRSIKGFIRENCIEMLSFRDRHMYLAAEMERRGLKHDSDLPSFIDYSYLTNYEKEYVIDRQKAWDELMSRCTACKSRAELFYKKNRRVA